MKNCQNIINNEGKEKEKEKEKGNGKETEKNGDYNESETHWRQIRFLLFGGFHNKPFDCSFVIVTTYFRSRQEKLKQKITSGLKKNLGIETKCDVIKPQFCDISEKIDKYYGFSLQAMSDKHYLLFGGTIGNNYSDKIFSLKLDFDENGSQNNNDFKITFKQLHWVSKSQHKTKIMIYV